MNNQNVQNLVEYIRKNPNLPPSQLEESVLKAGYSREEFNRALEIVGKSQINTNLSVEQNIASAGQEVMTPEENKQTNKTWLFVILGVLIILAFWDIVALYLINQNKVKTTVDSPTPTPLSSPAFKALTEPTKEPVSIQPPTTVAQANPMDVFFTALSSANYKVTASGKIELKKQEEGVTQTLSLDLDNGIVYIQKGSVLRIDKTDPQQPEIAMIKGDKIYILDPSEKTYTVLNTADSLGQFYLGAFKTSFPLIPLTEDTQKGLVAWQKISNNEWQADWKWKTPLDPQETPVKVKIILDPATNLITTLFMKSADAQPWQDATFRYETIEGIESLLTVPSDYKEEKLDF